MSLVRRKRRRALSMTSLIDVIFLLLLFFMLSSTFSKYGAVDLPSGGGAGTTQSASETFFLHVSADEMSLNGRMVTAQELQDALMGDQEKTRLIASFKANTTAQHLADVLANLRSVPALSIALLGARP